MLVWRRARRRREYIATGFTGALIIAALVRYRWIIGALRARAVFSAAARFWWSAFALLYVIAYVYTMPPVGGAYLPVAWTGNIDLLTYIRYTRYLWDLGPSNLAGFGYLDYVYLQTPGVFYLFGWFSMLFGSDPLSTVMPVQFALTALIGIVAARMSHAVFGVRRLTAVAIGCIVIGAPFFRYVAGAYFLSTLMSTPALLYLLWITVSSRPARLLDVPMMIRFASVDLLLLFIYPFLLFAGVGMQLGAIALMGMAGMPATNPGARGEGRRQVGRTVVAMAAAFGIVAASLQGRLRWSLDMVTGLSQVGVAGWPLEVISPFAMYGFPGMRGDGVQVDTPELRVWAVAALCALASALSYVYWWHRRHATTPPQKTLVALTSGGILLYRAYYVRIGPSYQQWKFATYTILPLSFVVFAAVARLVQDVPRPKLTRPALATIAIFLIGGNLLVHVQYDRALVRLPGALRSLEQVDRLPFFRDITVQMQWAQHLFGTYVALYMLPSKRVHVISDVFAPSEKLSFETISRVRPYFFQDDSCESVGHVDTMKFPGLGCLVLSPPSPASDTVYPFNRTFLFITWDRMTAREQGGRWNVRPTLNLQISADPQRTHLAADAHVNLFLNPYLPPGVKPQRLVFSWGGHQRGEIVVGVQEWISLPVRTADWTGTRSWTLPISIAFPDGRTILFHALSISTAPRGRVVTITQ